VRRKSTEGGTGRLKDAAGECKSTGAAAAALARAPAPPGWHSCATAETDVTREAASKWRQRRVVAAVANASGGVVSDATSGKQGSSCRRCPCCCRSPSTCGVPPRHCKADAVFVEESLTPLSLSRAPPSSLSSSSRAALHRRPSSRQRAGGVAAHARRLPTPPIPAWW
jgi:hypothetical protein